ncbi:AraC family transcriptional regulator [Cognatiyoonia sp. IB215182]|uniref:AraC family transcriptional regulator n=1 Tax=Cognatiyoonia sp. IB215182 TaxID=3097353 RepID=UPI002A179E5A|nr:AraC family transcriptional regulator [Cognatiyoonia sp. IB215182]MDX8355112.1 AraC family transcriptional regulator [Cognatiyoonia sp. IB215182]
MDPLSDILSILRPQSHLAGLLDLGHPSAIGFPDQAGALKCNAMISGAAWVSVKGRKKPVLVKEGEFFILPTGRPFAIKTDRSLESQPIEKFLTTPLSEKPAVVNGGGDAIIASCRFTVSQDHAFRLISMLPSILVIPSNEDIAAHLRHCVELILDELAKARPGSALIVQHLSQVVLIQTLRHHYAENGGELSWLGALTDRRLTLALTAMHDDPGKKWTLCSLAEAGSMSRSVFARRFQETVGQSPMEYLSVLRMIKASDQLISTGCTIAAVAEDFGYRSENAFNTAFKRVMGNPPRQYVNERTKSLSDAGVI